MFMTNAKEAKPIADVALFAEPWRGGASPTPSHSPILTTTCCYRKHIMQINVETLVELIPKQILERVLESIQKWVLETILEPIPQPILEPFLKHNLKQKHS